MEKLSIVALVVVALLAFWAGSEYGFALKATEEKVERLEQWNKEVKLQLIKEGKYRCCLKEPCSYCLEHGECDCLDSVMEGNPPCGECLGELIEGEGNPYLDKELIRSAISKALAS